MITAPLPHRAPLYRQIEAQLRGRIESGELRPGDRLPSINDLRRHFGGVNHLTVRQALKHLTADGLVRAEQGRGLFVHKPVRRTGRVALVVPQLDTGPFLEIARGVQRALDEAGLKTLLLETHWDRDDQAGTLGHLGELSIDGVVLIRGRTGEWEGLPKAGCPAILVEVPNGVAELAPEPPGSGAALPVSISNQRLEQLGCEAAGALLSLLEGQRL